MDIGGGLDPDVFLEVPSLQNEEQSRANLSDVDEAIRAVDPTFTMPETYVQIIEEPASKALRFRYECEGRSAGSIPGASSTSENKTYPTIKVCGYKGCMVIVVSCITKDEPFKAHPHNLVGRECSSGVCTVKLKTEGDLDYAVVPFKNLGIQCIKRRDISTALNKRQELRVDPFRAGFSHAHQPQSIDLNAVRLCFQVFLTDESYHVQRALRAVYSDVIYDKKAMSELMIVRTSHCSGPVGGNTTVILLCEKVTRDDIEVLFFHKESGWADRGHVEFVHKQLALVFKTPAYRDPLVTHHVTVQYQLHRMSDGAKSNVYNFEYVPKGQGTARKPLDLGPLAADANNNRDKLLLDLAALAVRGDADASDSSPDRDRDPDPDPDSDPEPDLAPAPAPQPLPQPLPDTNGKSLDELLDQVAELDEIYTENRTRLENMAGLDPEDPEDFDDAGTYTSLQLAFKNPIEIEDALPYEDVQVPAATYRGPIVEFAPLKRDPDDEKAPPLPPKRVRRTSAADFKTSQTSVDGVLKPGKQLPVTRNPEVLKRERTELSVARSEPSLPPAKKRSFLSRLFRRKERSPAPSVKSEGRKERKAKPVGRSVSSVSGQRPARFGAGAGAGGSHASLKDSASGAGLSYADSVTHISLHGDADDARSSQASLRRGGPAPPGATILVAESVLALDASAFRKLQDDLDLTDAEQYALYMAVAPHATVSEFDETSCYYSPVDASKFHANE